MVCQKVCFLCKLGVGESRPIAIMFIFFVLKMCNPSKQHVCGLYFKLFGFI